MPRTRSVAQHEAADSKSNDNLPETGIETDADAATPASFNGRLSRFQYAGKDKASGDTASDLPETETTRSSPLKRPLSAVQSRTSNSPSPAKKRRATSKYAPPSRYAHLPPLVDILEPNLICVFVGTNPGIRTATAGHAYAHPSNLFWKLLHSSGCTDRRLDPTEDVDLPRLYAMGNTNIVERPSKDAAELSKEEMAAGTPILEEKFARYRPEAVCVVGKGIWEAIWRWRHGRNPKKEEFRWGWQDEEENMGRVEGERGWDGAKVFVTSSTSGLSASLRPHEKEAIWKPFGEWVKQRRAERIAAVADVEGRDGLKTSGSAGEAQTLRVTHDIHG
ncbi:uracil DNA N-glycosylase Thp1 [Zalaria obscura]|uniref:Uracil DNA N-glycosylase Thp1 n=1 Tax=Zalaria obscura TaxID=2024903 RepID=A0ACC3S400_9PEZI